MACGPTKREKKISSNPSSISEELVAKAGPDYQTQFAPEDVELEVIEYAEEIDQVIAIKLISNTCKSIKADYLNYSLDFYKTSTPTDRQLEPMFDAEHIGKFIVWQYINKKTDCLADIFLSIDLVFSKGDAEAYTLAKYGIFDMMILESRKLDVNYNTAFLPFFNEDTKKRYLDYIWHEVESGRS